MKTFYFLFLLSLASLSLRAEPLPGVPINGPIVPVDSTDVYPTFDPWWGKGGLRMATNLTTMLNIVPLRREAGMVVYVHDTGQYWSLNNDLVNWTLWGSGGNIYTQDGYLNSNRTINGNGMDFTLNNVASMRLHGQNVEIYTTTGQMDIGSNFRMRLHTPLYGTSNVWAGMVLKMQDNGDLEYATIDYTGPATFQTNHYTIATPEPHYFTTNNYPHGSRVWFTVPLTNTGPASVQLAAGPRKEILTADKQPLFSGAMKALSIANLQYASNLDAWILNNPAIIATNSGGGGSITNPPSDVIFLKDFGAVGDGFTDDTTAFLDAIAAAANRTLDIGKGLYVISPVTITNNVEIVGHHTWGTVGSPPNATDYSGFIKKPSTVGHMITVGSDVRVSFHYLYLDGNKANNTDATSYNVYFPIAGAILAPGDGECLMNHVVNKNSKGGGLLIERARVHLDNQYISDMELHGIRVNAQTLIMENVVITRTFGDGILIDTAPYLNINGLRVNETRGHSINVNGSTIHGSIKNGTLEHPMKSAIRIGATFQHNVIDNIRMWGANAQQNLASSTNGAYPQGTWSTVLYDLGSYALDNNRYVNCRIGGYSPTLSGLYGTRKVKYNIEWLNGSYTAGYQQELVNCYFSHSASTVTGNWTSGLQDLASIINYKDDLWEDTGFYFGKHMQITPTNGTALRTIQSTVAGTEYPLVIDPASGLIKQYPTNYSLAFTGGIGWVPPDPLRIVNFVYEDYAASPSSAVGSYQMTGTATVGGSVSGLAGITNHPGMISISTGTSTNGGYTISTRGDAYSFAADETWTLKVLFRVTSLSTGASDYEMRLGFGDAVGSAADTDGIYLTYNHYDNAGRWRLMCREASSTTFADGTTSPVASVWQYLVMTFTTTSVSASVNGVSVGTVNSNIPDGANKVGFLLKIFNTGIVDPNSAHIMEIDAFQYYCQRTTDRL